MRRTLFAGLTALDPGESLSTDGFSFQSSNPDVIDALLEVGAVTHKHDAHDALANPVIAPSATASAAGGTIPGSQTFYFGYTLIDEYGGETEVSPAAPVTTPDQLAAPSTTPTTVAQYTAGSLPVGTYYYAITWTDEAGGETTLGGYSVVDREPGYASGQIEVSGLTTGMVAAGATTWRLYRAAAGGSFMYLANGDSSTDIIYDDGTLCSNCAPPPDTNTTAFRCSIEVTIPSITAGSESWRLYGTQEAGTFTTPAFVASGVASGTVLLTTFAPSASAPPPRSRALRGAAQIDPDTDILDWHWLRPVDDQAALPSGAVESDVRVTEDTGDIWVYHSGTWRQRSLRTDRRGHTFALSGEIKVASGATDYIPPFFVVLPSGSTGTVTRAKHVVQSGGPATVKLTKNGTDLTGFTGISVTTTASTTTGSAAVIDGDLLALVVTSVTGTPKNLTFTITLETETN